jgi:TFIIF-interacting CTD phosphatase-like protein
MFGLPVDQRSCDKGKKTLVLDLDETLIHSEFSDVSNFENASLILKIKG